MKRLLLKGRLALGFLLAASTAVSAQDISDYAFTVSTATYTPLPATADVLATGDDAGSLDDQTFEVSMPFDFSYNGIVSNVIYVNANGFITFGGDCTFATPILDGNSDAEAGIVAACNTDLLGASTEAVIRTGVTGVAPFRSFVIEWTNMDELNNYLAASFDPEATSLNFQITLHEGDGIPAAQSIDLNYGDMSVSEDISISAGLRYSFDVNLVTSSSDWSSLVATTSNLDQVPLTSTVAPAPGTIITFAMTGEPLPVILQEIAAVNIGRENIVSWIPAHEESGDRYILERSGNGKDFLQLCQVAATGAGAKYSYQDYSPLAGINYYRLHILNKEQTGFYSKIVTATVAPAGNITLAPNPATDQINISGLNAYIGGRLSVINAIGQVIRNIMISRDNEALDVSALDAGTYFVSVQSGSFNKTFRFVRR